ncbi:MAG: hypothetical protein HS111_24595 [Kofleriaceae bacterium]|nr:hypothetical protein [Kofleriaceae bacterium]
MIPTRLFTLAALGAVTTLLACGAEPGTRPGAGARGGELADAPVRLPLELVQARGEVAVRTAGDPTWRPLAAGAPLTGVRELKVSRHGAIVSIGHGDAAGRLWLRAGTHLRLAQDDHGVQLELVAGKSRVRRSAAAMPVTVMTAGGARAVAGDVLLTAAPGGATAITATAARPELADWTLALARAPEVAGLGRLEAATDHGVDEELALRRVDVRVRTAGDHALTEVEHVFFNPAAEAREGTFRFPVPDRALLTGLAMEINGALMEGEIVEREKARKIYEKIVDDMQDPALLEWEQGNWFKLRVFPIEATAEKRVVIRYAQPLVGDAAGWSYEYSLGLPEGDATIGALTVTVDGQEVVRETDVRAGLDLSVPVAAAAPAVMRETRADGTYTAVRVTPDPALFAAAGPGAGARPRTRDVVVVVDTSRSMLEARPLQLELLRTTLAELGAADRFVVLASDVAVTAHAPAPVAVNLAAITDAVAFIDGIEPDGATDVAAALRAAAARTPSDVIYLGDGVPTWGELDRAALAGLAADLGAPIHAAILGKGASSELWQELAGASGGRAMVVRRAIDAARFALAVGHGGDGVRMRGARVVLAGGAAGTLYPHAATTAWDGDTLTAIVHTPAGSRAARAAPGRDRGWARGRAADRPRRRGGDRRRRPALGGAPPRPSTPPARRARSWWPPARPTACCRATLAARARERGGLPRAPDRAAPGRATGRGRAPGPGGRRPAGHRRRPRHPGRPPAQPQPRRDPARRSRDQDPAPRDARSVIVTFPWARPRSPSGTARSTPGWCASSSPWTPLTATTRPASP